MPNQVMYLHAFDCEPFRNMTLERRPQVEIVNADDGIEFDSALRQAYDFLRRHGRYTRGTLQTLLAMANDAEYARSGVTDVLMPAAQVIRAVVPSSYDEETEVKYGGMAGIAVVLPPDNKLLLAVHSVHRRGKIGSLLLEAVTRTQNTFVAWVSAQNFVGQQFLLSHSLFPVSMNGSGAVCYSLYAEDGVEMAPGERDDYALRSDEDLLRRPRRPRQVLRDEPRADRWT